MRLIDFDRLIAKYFSDSNKLKFNSDDCEINWAGNMIRQYENGTRKLNKRHKRVGGVYNTKLGYDRKKLD
jgi:hypothetical protein